MTIEVYMTDLLRVLADLAGISPESRKNKGLPTNNVVFKEVLRFMDDKGKFYLRAVGDYDKETDTFWLSEKVYDALKKVGVSGVRLYANVPTGKKYVMSVSPTKDPSYYGLVRFE